MRPYESYVYAYPHKTAYRPLDPRPRLKEVWSGERPGALYVHIPFCEMRCGFCNLFTRTGAPEELVTAYLDALERQAEQVREALQETGFATAAFGGGTPTYLGARELTRLFDLTERTMGVDLARIPLSVETSPATATPDRLSVLAERGTSRVSIGVQSFVPEEARSAVRPQKRAEVDAALDTIRASGVPVLNIDLIYGIDGQTPRSWLYSLDTALGWRPEELYLYPLYVRPLTGLGKQGRAWDDQRLELYRTGRDHLLAAGYEQVSMRMFRLPGTSGSTDYCCQSDGMVGLGCGARSYTGALHYSFDYAVGARHVRSIIDEYVAETDFGTANVGFVLSPDESRRRHLLQSLLQAEGMSRGLYAERFGSDVLDDFPLGSFADRLTITDSTVALTPEGLAYSDAIGPALFSPRVRALMDGYEAC
ncbi:oxygen-independent coproporphyrinogen-3 oxidase [Nonomuraea thailandensis]|uniref:Heme chaperone HemW n=1 Tax=Nonomuraea thailandensis TaxID=1188745 RepID=A0A9X2GWA5_9ACTN|nr:STM4012 family radical SAM protein [Nonomuraea thailandensis]MCP2361528.1 oxygen-independent coproporphyrinogen-3 oxidase [Nonomuraea thailandensis]